MIVVFAVGVHGCMFLASGTTDANGDSETFAEVPTRVQYTESAGAGKSSVLVMS